MMSLYRSSSRVALEIESSRSRGDNNNGEMALARLEAIVIEQLATADDALEDWSDLVPEEVAELRAKFGNQRDKRGGQ